MRWGILRGVVLVAALAAGVGGCVTKRAVGDRAPAPLATPASYGECAATRDVPSCLLSRAIATDGVTTDGVLANVLVRAVVEGGSVDVALRHRAALTALRGKLSIVFAMEPGSMEYLRASSEEAFAAALVLAAAAQIADDPFAHKAVKPLIAKVERGEAAVLAAMIWRHVSFGSLWRPALTRPRGWPAIWRAIIAAPPKDTARLAGMVADANVLGLEDEAVTLARIVLTRADANEDQLFSARLLINAADRTAADAAPVYDAASVKEQVETCQGYRWCADVLAEAAAAGAADDLKIFGADLASRARREAVAEDKTAIYGAASEAFRLAGEIPAALAVAREGLRFVPAAMAIPEGGRIEVAAAAGTFAFDDDAIAPVIALYRAGARDEAIRSGYLSGYARFRHATVAGETPDARWIIADKSDFTLWRFLYELTEKPAPTAAAQLYEGLRCSEAMLSDVMDTTQFNTHLATLAALIGRAGSTRAHLTTAAVSLDSKDQFIPGFKAQTLASDWRRALVIAERIGAKDDKLAAPSCGVGP